MNRQPCETCRYATASITSTGERVFCMNNDCEFCGDGGCSAEANCEWYKPKHTNVATDLTVRDVFAAAFLVGVLASGARSGRNEVLVAEAFALADLCMRQRAE